MGGLGWGADGVGGGGRGQEGPGDDGCEECEGQCGPTGPENCSVKLQYFTSKSVKFHKGQATMYTFQYIRRTMYINLRLLSICFLSIYKQIL